MLEFNYEVVGWQTATRIKQFRSCSIVPESSALERPVQTIRSKASQVCTSTHERQLSRRGKSPQRGWRILDDNRDATILLAAERGVVAGNRFTLALAPCS